MSGDAGEDAPGLYDPDEYAEGHSPFCHRSCDHSCHDAYDLAVEQSGSKAAP